MDHPKVSEQPKVVPQWKLDQHRPLLADVVKCAVCDKPGRWPTTLKRDPTKQEREKGVFKPWRYEKVIGGPVVADVWVSSAFVTGPKGLTHKSCLKPEVQTENNGALSKI